MNFFIWRKNNVSFLRYLDFCVYVKSTNFQICDVIIGIATKWKLRLWILSTIKMKFGQILLFCRTHISNMFWPKTGEWKLVLDPFLIVLKWQYSKIWPFLIMAIYHFKWYFIHLFEKMEHCNLDIIGYWVIWADC